jgi:hypothetical protein
VICPDVGELGFELQQLAMQLSNFVQMFVEQSNELDAKLFSIYV